MSAGEIIPIALGIITDPPTLVLTYDEVVAPSSKAQRRQRRMVRICLKYVKNVKKYIKFLYIFLANQIYSSTIHGSIESRLRSLSPETKAWTVLTGGHAGLGAKAVARRARTYEGNGN